MATGADKDEAFLQKTGDGERRSVACNMADLGRLIANAALQEAATTR